MKRTICFLMVIMVCLAICGCGENNEDFGEETTETGSHSCYVCGVACDYYYEGHYYCSEHAAWVKTVVENQ